MNIYLVECNGIMDLKLFSPVAEVLSSRTYSVISIAAESLMALLDAGAVNNSIICLSVASNRLGSAICKAAAYGNNITVLVEGEGYIRLNYPFSQEATVLKSDYACVWAERGKRRWLVEAASPYDSKKLYTTGNPKFDILYRPPTMTKAMVLSKLGIPQGSKLVVFATQAWGGYSEEVAAGLLSADINAIVFLGRALKELDPNTVVLVKIHPAATDKIFKNLVDSGFTWSGLARQHGNGKILVTDTETHRESVPNEDLMVYADFWCSVSSTTCVERVILKKPAVYLNLSGNVERHKTAPETVVPIISVLNNVDIFVDMVNSNKVLYTPEGYQWLIDNYLYKDDGKSAERVADVIDRICATDTRLVGVK